MFISYYTEGYYKAGAEAAKRRSMQEYYDIRNQQRKQGFAALSKLFGIGSTLWDTYSSNRELIDYAEKHGLKTETSGFTNIFGTPSFSTAKGDPVSRQDVLAAQLLEDFNKQKSLIDSWSGGTD